MIIITTDNDDNGQYDYGLAPYGGGGSRRRELDSDRGSRGEAEKSLSGEPLMAGKIFSSSPKNAPFFSQEISCPLNITDRFPGNFQTLFSEKSPGKVGSRLLRGTGNA